MPWGSQTFEEKKTANVFIDGGYIRGLIRDLGKEMILNDYRKYSNFLQLLINDFSGPRYPIGKVVVTRKFYYDAIVPVKDDPNEYNTKKKFFDSLQHHMVMVEVKLGDKVKNRQKGVDTLIAIDMLVKAYLGHYEVACLIAGDRDFVNVVKAVKDYTGKIVVGVYEPKSTAKELIKTFDLRHPIAKEELKKYLPP